MAKYDVYRLAALDGLVVDVQADLLEPLNTRVVVPLLALEAAPKPAKRLNPIFEIQGIRYVMVTQFVSAVQLRDLGRPVANLDAQSAEITTALDMLFQGFGR